MKINIVAFGIAKEIINSPECSLEVKTPCSVGSLKETLMAKYEEFQKLKSIKFAINEDYQEDHFMLNEGDEVVIIPPVSGG